MLKIPVRTEGRKTRLALSGLLAALLITTVACNSAATADNRAAAETAVKDADAQWSKVAGTRDLDATVAYYTDDASLLSPNAPIATSKQAIRAVWAGLLSPDMNVSWQVTKAEAAQSCDLAYVVGTYQITPVNDKGKPMEDRRKEKTGSASFAFPFTSVLLRGTPSADTINGSPGAAWRV